MGGRDVSRFVNGAIIGIVSFIVLLSIFWYLAEIRREATITYGGMENRWGNVDASSTEIRSRLTFHNPHRTTVELVRIEHELIVNGQRVDWDYRNVSVRVGPESNGSVDVDARFPNSFLGPWWLSHINQGEETRFVVRGTATFLVMQKPVVVPYDWESDWTTDLATALPESLRNCASVMESPCIRSAALEWDTTTEAPVAVVRLSLANTNASTLALRNWTTELRFQDLAIARADVVPGPLELPPQGERDVDLTFRFDTRLMATWWPRHVASCELSPITATMTFNREQPNNSTPPAGDSSSTTLNASSQPAMQALAWSVPAQPFTTHFVCART
jgi:LEA14-like dessication related protein